MEYMLAITCPLCGGIGYRESTAPFISLDAKGIHAHSAHAPGCAANETTTYEVVRTPPVYRQLPGDPQPPEAEGAA